jgi:hypothetical protein
MEQRSWAPIHEDFIALFGSAPLSQAFDYLPFKKWTPDPKRARTFFKAWVANDVGVQSARVLKAARLDAEQILTTLKDPSPPPSIEACFIHGAAGCGKSWPIQNTIRQWATPKNLAVELAGSYLSFFRVALLDDWKKKLSFPESFNYCLKTFENILGHEVEFLIVDEISQAPPGWLDFIVLWNNNLRRVIILGDICQGQFVSSAKEPLPIDLLPSAATTLLSVSTPYINFTRRLPQLLSQRLGLSTRSEELGEITFGHQLQTSGTWQTLLPSMNDAAVYSQLLQRPCYTYTSPQGKEWENVQLIVTPAALVACSFEALWTAVTRCKRRLHIVFAAAVNKGFLGAHRFWGPLLGYQAPMNNTRLFPKLQDLQLMDDPQTVAVFGCTPRSVGEVLSSWTFQRYDELPPSFRALMPLIQEPGILEHRLEEPSLLDHAAPTHLPPGWNNTFAAEAQPPRAREERELFWREVMGKQYDDVNGKVPRQPLEQIFPRQSAGRDSVLLPTAIEKRLRFSNENRNRERFSRMNKLGPGIFERFRSRFGLPERHDFDPEAFLRCTAETEARKLEKPIATIWNNIDRSDPDWARNHMEVFVKSQHKAKAETLAFKQRLHEMDDITLQAEFAKAGQTLVTSPDINVFELGPIARYMREVVKQHLPDNVYLHGGKTINEFNDWSCAHATDEPTFTCDFTAYDQSCTEETLSFELAFMEYCGIPKELTELYEWIKLTMHTQYGTTAVMRFTGEFGTYDFNTFWNMAYMTLRYDPDPKIAACYSGDDSLFFGNLKETNVWPMFQRYFTLVGKTAYSDLPEFCGWFMYSYGVVRNPILLALKIAYRQARGELVEILDNYFLEALFAHRHGDQLYKTLPPLALEAQRWVMDFCFQNAPIVPHLASTLEPTGFKRIPWLLLPLNIQNSFLALGQNLLTSL